MHKDVAFIYWGGHHRRGKPKERKYDLWDDFARGFHQNKARVIPIDDSSSRRKVVINLKKYPLSDIKYVIFQEVYGSPRNRWGLPILKNTQILEDKMCGMLTTDYWTIPWGNNVTTWLDAHKCLDDFIITVHKSAEGLFNDNLTLSPEFKILSQQAYAGSSSSEENFSFKPCNRFRHHVRSSFCVNKEEINRHTKFPKEFDICLGGVVKWNKLYPFRKRLHTLMESRFHVINPTYGMHRGYRKYYKSIAMSRASLSTSGIIKNSVKKYLEIPALGSCIIGNLPLEFSFLEPITLSLIDDMSDNEICTNIEKFLHNVPPIQNVQNYVLENYNCRSVISRMIQSIKGCVE